MTLKYLSAVLVTTAMVTLTGPVFAQDKSGQNLDESATGEKGGVAQFTLAQDLYAMGVTTKDALLVVTAAKLASGVQMTDVEREKENEAGSGEEDTDTADAPIDAATMIATAKDLAAGDETLLALVDDIEAEGSRGRIGGASRTLSRLPAGSIDVWKVPFYGGSYAEMGISGDGDAPLSVLVTDENGNRIYCPSASWDKFYCDFVPKWNGYFFVSVKNNGRKRNSYQFLTN
jgi:hypothetical protein